MNSDTHDVSGGDDWPVGRSAHVPPHDRFFEEGEEPPERYDLPNRIDYLLEINPDPIPSSRWFRIGFRAARRLGIRQYWYSIRYYLQWLILCAFTLFSQFLLGPAFHAEITNFYLSRLTGSEQRFGKSNSPRRWIMTIAIANLPTQVSRLLTIVCIAMLAEVTTETVLNLHHELEARIYMWTLFSVCSLPILLAHAFVAVRVGGFTTHLILDHKLGSMESIQANWRITQSRTWQLMRLKLALWLIKYPIGFVTYGLGIVLIEPFCAAVWTAAYLDIAGSEPIREF